MFAKLDVSVIGLAWYNHDKSSLLGAFLVLKSKCVPVVAWRTDILHDVMQSSNIASSQLSQDIPTCNALGTTLLFSMD